MKIFLSGGDAAPHGLAALAVEQPPHVLMSFVKAEKLSRGGDVGRNCGYVEWVSVMRAARMRMIDSGAFSFLFGDARGRAVDWDAYLARYIAWLETLRRARWIGVGDLVVEVDMSAAVGYAWVHRQRAAMLAAGFGPQLMCVWHTDADWAYWEHLVRDAAAPGRSGIVAIEGIHVDRPPIDYARHIASARSVGVRVHGFMITDARSLETLPFYSVDSTSWLSCARWGGSTKLSRYGVGARSVDDGTSPGRGVHWSALVQPLRKSIRTWVGVERRVTDVWRARGVDWDPTSL